MSGSTAKAPASKPARKRSSCVYWNPPMKPIVPVCDVKAAATPTRKEPSCSANSTDGAPGTSTSTYANVVSGNSRDETLRPRDDLDLARHDDQLIPRLDEEADLARQIGERSREIAGFDVELAVGLLETVREELADVAPFAATGRASVRLRPARAG